MDTSVNAGARLDRLPISSFHKRIFLLIGAGMFFDGYDLYVGTNVLGAVVQSKFATLEQVPQFISLTFLGLTLGSNRRVPRPFTLCRRARKSRTRSSGDLCHEAPTHAVTRISCSSATGSIDNSPGGFFLH